MTLINNRAPFLYHIKLCASFRSHQWIQTWVTIRKRSIRVGQNRWFFVPCDLEIWRMTLENNRAHLLCCFKLCVSIHSHRWFQTGVTVRTRPNWVKIDYFIVLCDIDIWQMTLKNNRAPLNSGQNRRFFVPCDLEIWRRTLKNNGHLFYITSQTDGQTDWTIQLFDRSWNNANTGYMP